MVETWLYVIGGIIVALIGFVIAYQLISSSIEYSQKQNALNQFSSLYSDINTVCIQELYNSIERKFSIPSTIRVVYVTNDTVNALPKVNDLIKKEQLSFGDKVCLQFKREQFLRCYPEPPINLSCYISMPYMGVLEESEDIWIKITKILGRPMIREYQLCIKKVWETNVKVNFDVENCTKFTPTTIPSEIPTTTSSATTIPGATTTAPGATTTIPGTIPTILTTTTTIKKWLPIGEEDYIWLLAILAGIAIILILLLFTLTKKRKKNYSDLYKKYGK